MSSNGAKSFFWNSKPLLTLNLFILSVCVVLNLSCSEQKKSSKPLSAVSKEPTSIAKPPTKDGNVGFADALNRYYSKGVTKQNNSAVLYFQVLNPVGRHSKIPEELYDQLGITKPQRGVIFRDFFDFVKDENKVKKYNPTILKIYETLWPTLKRPWKAMEFPVVDRWLNSNKKQLSIVIRASVKRKFYAPMIPIEENDPKKNRGFAHTSPGRTQFREVYRALIARAMRHLGKENHEKAWQDLLAANRVVRHTGVYPTGLDIDEFFELYDDVVRKMFRFLLHSKPDTKTLNRCVRDLEKLAPLPDFVERMNYLPRFSSLNFATHLSQNDNIILNFFSIEEFQNFIDPNIQAKDLQIQVDADFLKPIINSYYDTLVIELKKIDPARTNESVDRSFEKLDNLLNSKKEIQMKIARAKTFREKISLVCWYRSIHREFYTPNRDEQSHRNLRVAFALAAYKSDHGKYPDKLSELSPKFIEKIPSDFFTGKSLKYKIAKDGYLLYSLGFNGKDDNGFSIYSGEKNADDISVRMPPRVN